MHSSIHGSWNKRVMFKWQMIRTKTIDKVLLTCYRDWYDYNQSIHYGGRLVILLVPSRVSQQRFQDAACSQPQLDVHGTYTCGSTTAVGRRTLSPLNPFPQSPSSHAATDDSVCQWNDSITVRVTQVTQVPSVHCACAKIHLHKYVFK